MDRLYRLQEFRPALRRPYEKLGAPFVPRRRAGGVTGVLFEDSVEVRAAETKGVDARPSRIGFPYPGPCLGVYVDGAVMKLGGVGFLHAGSRRKDLMVLSERSLYDSGETCRSCRMADDRLDRAYGAIPPPGLVFFQKEAR